MVHNKSKRTKAKTILRLPDLEQSKTAVLHSLGAASSQESYRHAIDEFIGWYCSEPRLAFNRTVVLRYRFFLEQEKSRTFDDQRSTGRRAATGIRGGRHRPSEPGARRGHPPRQRRQAIGRQDWKLAQHRPGERSNARACDGDRPRQARPRDSRVTDRLRAPPCGACCVEEGRFPAPRRSLGIS